MQNYIRRLADIFHETGAIKYGNFTLASGKKSKYKIDAEIVLDNDEGAGIISNLFSKKIAELESENKKEYRIAGVAKGGAKVAEIVSKALGRDYVSLNHKNNEVIGRIDKTEHVILEDVTTTGGSIIKCYEMFLYPTAPVKNTIAIVDRQEGAAENLAKLGIKHYYFLTKEDLGITEI